MKRLAAVSVLVGCYSPTAHPGSPCASNGDCPSPFQCVAGFCGGDAGSNAIDAPGSGADAADAPMIDAAAQMIASNGVVGMFPAGGNDITITGTATFNTDTGHITGNFARSAGTGTINGVDFEHATYMSAPLGVFSFHKFSVTSTGHVQFTGAAAAVFVVAVSAQIDGEIAGPGGLCGGGHACAGPGGGAGGTASGGAAGCGPGGPGVRDAGAQGDTGGGGGGGSIVGAAGGTDGMSAGGAGGSGCIAVDLQPLVGGSGGGIGSPGAATGTPSGGGGGGAFQLTAFGSISITGKLGFGGAGGEAGPGDSVTGDGGAGAGGGGGGGVLLEAPTITISSVAILAANGGGGGGGANSATAGTAGTAGGENATPAAGGPAAAAPSGPGGNGGAAASAPTTGTDATTGFNGGGGGGAYGVIYVRSMTSAIDAAATISPPAGTGPVLTQ